VSDPTPHPDVACRNCGAPAPLRFCAACGQETAVHAPTLDEFLHEFVGHYVAFEGALWRTMGLLMFRPGRLTREYLAGRPSAVGLGVAIAQGYANENSRSRLLRTQVSAPARIFSACQRRNSGSADSGSDAFA